MAASGIRLEISFLFIATCIVCLFNGCQTETELSAPCMGCRLFNMEHRNYLDKGKKDHGFCHYPCQCPYTELKCHHGVNVVKDGCGCCYMCARQVGDMCSVKDKCDVDKGLYCSNGDENSSGICHSTVKKSCIIEGSVYEDGQKFQVDCSKLCTCQNGFYGCVRLCPQELIRPSEDTCHDPKLIQVKSKCCREWTCQKLDTSGQSLSSAKGLESQNLIVQNPMWYQTTTKATTTTATTTLANYGSSRRCSAQNTDWSPCSVTCNVGVSVRIVVDPATCHHFEERQLCFLRPCGAKLATLGRDKCTPTTRTPRRQHIHFQDCLSVKDYNLKFCTTCRKKKCCYPRSVRTKKIEFECTDGKREVMNYMWIKKCRCSTVCYKRDKRIRGKEKSKKEKKEKKKEKKMKDIERRREKRKRRRRRRRQRRQDRRAT